MRNVNMETLAGGVFGSSEFYINYEECKFQYAHKLSLVTICFILTMRNVN